jgi:hypothetical protein
MMGWGFLGLNTAVFHEGMNTYVFNTNFSLINK